MGAGKSTVGKRLAKRLGLPFVDSDSAIEDAAGYSAAPVAERCGERGFGGGARRLVARVGDGRVGAPRRGSPSLRNARRLRQHYSPPRPSVSERRTSAT